MANEEGWSWVYGSTKWHYFRGKVSLCGRILRFTHPPEGYEQGNDESTDNCAACKRKRLKEKQEQNHER